MSKASKDPQPLSKIMIIDSTAIDQIVAKMSPVSPTLTPEQIASIASQVDVSGKVDKITGSSLVANTEIAKIHSAGSDDQNLSNYVLTNDSRLHLSGSDNQDLSGLVVKETGKALLATTEAAKIHSNTLDHSNSLDHLNSADHAHTNKSTLDSVQAALTTVLKTSYDSAVTHASSSHAPATAQANADITKAEIEAKLTGSISSHSHAGGADPFTKLTLLADKSTGANVTPVTLGLSFNYEADSKYVIDIYAVVAPAVATTGCGFMIDVSTTVTFVGTFVSHQLAVTGTLSGAGSVGDLAAGSSGVSSGMVLTTAGNFVYGGGILVTGANTGTATFFFRSETTAVTTCKTGTIIRIMKI